MKIVNLISALLGLVAFASFAQAETKLVANSYRTTSVVGSVQWQESALGESKPLLANQDLPEGALINTGDASSVTLLFANGATAIVGEKSQIVVSKFQQEIFDTATVSSAQEPSTSHTEIKLNKGTVSTRVKKLLPQSTYIVQTPVGAAGVRGTIFKVVYDPVKKVLSVLTGEGKVVFTTIANQELPVDGGQNIVVYFDVDDQGNITLGNTTQGSLTNQEISDLLALFGLTFSDSGVLIPILKGQNILSDDAP